MADSLDVSAQENVLPVDNSLSGILDAALDKAAPPESPVPPPAAPEAAPSRRESESPAGESGQVRDQFGRFAPKEGSAPATSPSAPPASEAPQAPGVAAPVPGANEAPASWKADMRPLWDKVPAEMRPYLHEREQQLQTGFQAVAQRGQVAEAVLNEFVPYAEQLRSEGATPVAAIRTLLQTAHQLRTGGHEYKKAMLLGLATQYGVDLGQPVNMELAQAQAEAANLSVEKLYGSAQTQQQSISQLQQEFSAFSNDPQNEFFPQVRPIMALLVENNIAKDLRTAYDMAVGMDAGVRKTLIEREYQNRVRAEKAANAANLSVRGGPGGAKMQEAPKSGESLRDSIERALG